MEWAVSYLYIYQKNMRASFTGSTGVPLFLLYLMHFEIFCARDFLVSRKWLLKLSGSYCGINISKKISTGFTVLLSSKRVELISVFQLKWFNSKQNCCCICVCKHKQTVFMTGVFSASMFSKCSICNQLWQSVCFDIFFTKNRSRFLCLKSTLYVTLG